MMLSTYMCIYIYGNVCGDLISYLAVGYTVHSTVYDALVILYIIYASTCIYIYIYIYINMCGISVF